MNEEQIKKQFAKMLDETVKIDEHHSTQKIVHTANVITGARDTLTFCIASVFVFIATLFVPLVAEVGKLKTADKNNHKSIKGD